MSQAYPEQAMGPSGQPGVSSVGRELIARGWRRLRSRNLAIVALAVTGVLIIVGLTLPQPDRVGPEVYGRWREKNLLVAQVAEFIGLDRLFSTWWFVLVAVLLYLNTLACTITQVRAGVNRWLAQPDFPSPRFLQSTRHSFQAEIGRSPAVAIAVLCALLKKYGYRVRSLGDGESGVGGTEDSNVARLYAEKGKLSVLGSPVLHLGLLAALTAVAWSGLTRFDGYVEVGEGQAVTEAKGVYSQHNAGPLFRDSHGGFEVRVDRVEVDDPISIGRAVETNVRSYVTILEKGVAAAKGTLEVNRSLEYRGKRIFQTRLFGPGVVLMLTYPDGTADQGIVNLASTGGGKHTNSVTLPRTRYQATFGVDATDSSVDLEVFFGKSNVFSGSMKPGQKISFSDGVYLTLVDVRRWTGLQVVSDPSEPLLYTGFAITVLGLAITALSSRQQLWVLVEGSEAGSRVVAGGTAHKSRAMFAEEFDEIRDGFQKAAG